MSFPRYPTYKPSGVECLVEVPTHWDESRLGYECWVRARLGWKGLKADEYVDDGYVFLSTPNIKGREIDYSAANFITLDRFEESPEIKLREGDVLLAKDGSTLGTVNIVRKLPRPATVNSSIAVITPHGRLDGGFLFYVFQSSQMVQVIAQAKGGMGVPHLFQEDINRFRVLLPPLAEQTRIAEFLDRETAKIDELVAEQQRLMELLKEKRHAVTSHAVTRGLNPDAPLRPSGVDWIGKVPSHWDVVPIKHLCRIESGHTPQKSNEAFWIPEECVIPWVSLNDTKALATADFIDDTEVKISQLGISNSSAHLIEGGAVVMNRDGARIGLTAITTKPMCVSQHIIAWVCGQSVLNTYLLHVLYAMESEIYRLAGGATIPTIGMPDIREMVMPLPPPEEQEAIAEYLVSQRGQFDALTVEAQRSINLLQERRTALISAAVTGQIDVRNL